MTEQPSNPIHIVHIVYSFATGGLENGVVNIINQLPANEYRHSILCLTDHNDAFFTRIISSNTRIYDLHKAEGKSVTWMYSCWKLLRKLKPDICHSRNLSALEAQIPAFFANISTRIHGEHGWDVNDLGGRNLKYQKLRRILKPLIHHYVALSKEASFYLKDTIHVPPNKITHICNGVDVNKFVPNKNRALLPAGFANENSVVFGTVGRLAEVKNQTFLLSAFITLWKKQVVQQNNLRLVIVGDGILMPKLKSMVEQAGAQSVVFFAGQQDNVHEWMNQMDIFVLPSLAEGVSNTLLEGMACGLPYIATNVGGNADLVLPQHENTHIVEVNNNQQLITAMQHYVDSPSRIAQDSTLVRAHCTKNFSLAGMVEKYHQLYQKSINKGIK